MLFLMVKMHMVKALVTRSTSQYGQKCLRIIHVQAYRATSRESISSMPGISRQSQRITLAHSIRRQLTRFFSTACDKTTRIAPRKQPPLNTLHLKILACIGTRLVDVAEAIVAHDSRSVTGIPESGGAAEILGWLFCYAKALAVIAPQRFRTGRSRGRVVTRYPSHVLEICYRTRSVGARPAVMLSAVSNIHLNARYSKGLPCCDRI